MLNHHRSWEPYVNGFRCVHRGRLNNKRIGRINSRFHGQAAALWGMRCKSRPLDAQRVEDLTGFLINQLDHGFASIECERPQFPPGWRVVVVDLGNHFGPADELPGAGFAEVGIAWPAFGRNGPVLLVDC